MNLNFRCIFRDPTCESPPACVQKYQFLVDFDRSAQCAKGVQIAEIGRLREEPREGFYESLELTPNLGSRIRNKSNRMCSICVHFGKTCEKVQNLGAPGVS